MVAIVAQFVPVDMYNKELGNLNLIIKESGA